MNFPPHPSATAKETALRLLWKLSGRRPSVDTFFTSLLRHRRCLPVVEAGLCLPRFEESEVRLSRCPIGAWSTPMIDVYVLIKAAVGFGSRRILELGSYRGDTARLLAENTPADVRICTVDVHPDHGSSYRNTPVAARIDRKVGAITPDLFSAGEKYDFIFVDADHDYRSVMNDTMVAFQVLAEPGVVFWHDYHFHSYFHGMAGVPEALKYFSASHAIVSIAGTSLALYSGLPGWESAKLIARAQAGGPLSKAGVWQETGVRG